MIVAVNPRLRPRTVYATTASMVACVDIRMYALVEVKGKQYRVEEGQVITVDRMADTDAQVEINDVLLLSDDGKITIGSPHVPGAKVTATCEEHVRGRKVIIYKFKKRKNYRKKQGHRQRYTKLRIDKIEA
jgi:large subunit ribosomal protein L21